MRHRNLRLPLPVSALFACSVLTPAHGGTIRGMQVVGYGDRLSVQPGETIRFMVSSELPGYRADIVRLIHGDTNPNGPGFKEDLIDTPANKEYVGRHQDLPSGSYVMVPDSSALRRTGSFTIQAWIAPSTPGKGVQALLTKWSPGDRSGYGLFIEEDGSLAIWLGKGNAGVDKVRTGVPFPPAALRAGDPIVAGREPLHSSRWFFVAATYDSASGKVVLYQEPVIAWPMGDTPVVIERSVRPGAVAQNDVPFLMAAAWAWREGANGLVGSFYNGKIDSPRVFGRALSRDEVQALRESHHPTDAVAAWDVADNIHSRIVTDTSNNKLEGRTVNLPTRAVTGRNWTGKQPNYNLAPAEYAAIHFHDDDLDDAKWDVGFELTIPRDLRCSNGPP